MSTIRNVSPLGQVIPSLGLEVDAGATCDVPTKVAAELVARDEWAAVRGGSPSDVAREQLAPDRKTAPAKAAKVPSAKADHTESQE